MNKIEINGNRKIGEGEPPFIIAEIGNNHNGSIDTALELIKSAKDAGADAVKFQVKDIEKSFPKELLDSPYVNENSFGKTYREHKETLEFSKEQLIEVFLKTFLAYIIGKPLTKRLMMMHRKLKFSI